MVHTLTIIGALTGSITFTSLNGWRAYVKGQRVKASQTAQEATKQEAYQEANSAGLEDFLADVGAAE